MKPNAEQIAAVEELLAMQPISGIDGETIHK